MHRLRLCLALFAALVLGCNQKEKDESASSGSAAPAPAKTPPPKPPGKKPARPEPTPDPEPEPTPKAKPKVELPGAAIEITAEALAKAYQDDESAADAKYKRKSLLVSGAIFARFQFGTQHSLLLEGGVTCTIKPGSEKDVGTAQRGQQVRLIGRCDGDMGTLVIADSVVLEVKPAKYITVTADDLFADFAKDEKAAEKKYTSPNDSGVAYLHVTDARVAKIDRRNIYLTGPTTKDAKVQFLANYLEGDAKPFAGIKVGDRISVKGHCYFTGRDYLIDWATIAP